MKYDMDWLKDNAGLVIEIGLALFIAGTWIWDKFNKVYKARKSVDDFIETVDNHSKQIEGMNERHKEDYKQINDKIDTLIESINKSHEENRESCNKLRLGMIEQMSSDLTKSCEFYLERQSIEVYELTALINQFNAYENIGGNHGVYELVDKVKLLPIEYRHKEK